MVVSNADNVWNMIIYLMGAFKHLTMKVDLCDILIKYNFCKTLHQVLLKCYLNDGSTRNDKIAPDRKPQLVI